MWRDVTHSELCVPDILSGKKGWGAETGDKGLNQFAKTEHFKMEGLHLLPHLLQPQDWMVKMDLEDAYLQISIHPTPPHLPMGEELQIPVLTVWPLSSTKIVHQIAEAGGQFPEADRLSPDNISRRHTTNALGGGSFRTNYTTHLSIVWEPGVDCKLEEIYTDSHSGTGVSGIPCVLDDNETVTSLRKTLQN